jgi:hypothetical protein
MASAMKAMMRRRARIAVRLLLKKAGEYLYPRRKKGWAAKINASTWHRLGMFISLYWTAKFYKIELKIAKKRRHTPLQKPS